MSAKTRKRIWLVPMAAVIGVVVMLAVLATVTLPAGTSLAQPADPAAPMAVTGLSAAPAATSVTLSWTAAVPGPFATSGHEVEQRIDGASSWDSVADDLAADATSYMVSGLTAGTSYNFQVRAVAGMQGQFEGPWEMVSAMTTGGPTPSSSTDDGTACGSAADICTKSSSSTGSAAVKLTLAIEVLPENLTGSSWVEIYLENDYQEPGSIAKENVVFEVQGINPTETTSLSNPTLNTTFAAAAVEIDDGGKIDGEEDAVVISARIPDMRSGDETGYPMSGQTLIMVVSDAAGIKNPSEQGSHSTGFAIIRGIDDRADEADMKLDDLPTWAKISLSADDGGRGKEVTIRGSGFNDGVTAEAFVLVSGDKPDSCMALIDDSDSESLGTAAVGSDDKFSIVFTVHQDEFDPGMMNWICARDSESEGDGNRYSFDVDGFEVKDSLSITPATVASGEEVTLKPRDFVSETLEKVYLGGTEPENTLMCCATGNTPDPVQRDGSSDYVFDMPGGYSGSLRITVEYEGGAQASATITVEPSSLTLNQTEVAPNQSIIISGSGFSEDAEILTSNIQIDGKMLVVDDAGTEGTGVDRHVVTTSSGQFTATVNIWHDGAGNPALDADEYTIKVTDSNGYEGKTKITIWSPPLW